MKSKLQKPFPKSFWELFRLPFANGGFTLIEILVVVLIIGILGAIALPQYQRAVLKSRFAALMPIAKSMADSNEAFYLEHGEYADNAEDLPVQGRRNYSDGTELEFGTLTGYSYVLATRDNDFPNNYIVYQKHSENYPGEIHCEANANDTKAQEVCKSFGPTQELGETLTSGYLTYVLFGTGNGVAPEPPCDGVTCDAQGNITECASGKTLNNGACEDCATAFPGATSCSAISYAATECGAGYNLTTNGTCEAIPTCPTGAICNEQGTVTGCKSGYYLNGSSCASVGCSASMVGQTASISGATCSQVCDDTDDPACYEWTGGKKYLTPCSSYYCNERCSTDSAHGCAGSTFQGGSTYCSTTGTVGGCEGSVFSGKYTYCRADNTTGGCANSTFSGENSYCRTDTYGGCAGSTFIGKNSSCQGNSTRGACSGAIIKSGASCLGGYVGGCEGALYGKTTGSSKWGYCYDNGSCARGVPTDDTGTKWTGNCCNPAYMAEGTSCPSNVSICAS